MFYLANNSLNWLIPCQLYRQSFWCAQIALPWTIISQRVFGVRNLQPIYSISSAAVTGRAQGPFKCHHEYAIVDFVSHGHQNFRIVDSVDSKWSPTWSDVTSPDQFQFFTFLRNHNSCEDHSPLITYPIMKINNLTLLPCWADGTTHLLHRHGISVQHAQKTEQTVFSLL